MREYDRKLAAYLGSLFQGPDNEYISDTQLKAIKKAYDVRRSLLIKRWSEFMVFKGTTRNISTGLETCGTHCAYGSTETMTEGGVHSTRFEDYFGEDNRSSGKRYVPDSLNPSFDETSKPNGLSNVRFASHEFTDLPGLDDAFDRLQDNETMLNTASQGSTKYQFTPPLTPSISLGVSDGIQDSQANSESASTVTNPYDDDMDQRLPSHLSETPSKTDKGPVIFNGPVAIGYSAEQAAKILQDLGNQGSHVPGVQ